jgi:murein DD-endopeptidase MepM/ murein hydrolase activator NlpD
VKLNLFLFCLVVSVLAQTHTPSAFPLEVRASVVPRPFSAGGKVNLVYELYLTNLDRRGRSITLTRVEFLDDSSGRALADYSAAGLLSHLTQRGTTSKQPDLSQLAGGKRAIAFIWIAINPTMPLPTRVRHRVTAKIEGGTGDNVVECRGISVSSERPLVLGPPLHGGDWLAANGPSDSSAEHRRALTLLDGEAHIAQRFAIDWIRFGDKSVVAVGKGSENKDFFGYGAEVLAVANGTVRVVKDGVPENKPETLAIPISLDTIAGKYVCIDLGQGQYAFYAHLQPTSIRVKPGDSVKKGHVLALVGNSGNSDAPDLHFQVTDGPSVLGSEGVPYLIESFQEKGRGENFRFQPASAPRTVHAELPLDGVVVSFQ